MESGLFNFRSYVNLPNLFTCFLGFDVPTSFSIFIENVFIILVYIFVLKDSYLHIFDGNTDDCFRVGVAVKKTSLRLYTKFYSCDVIIASPLGLRTIIGGEGDKERDFDFLSSLEIVIIDQTDVFLMQNWDHVMVGVV